MTKGKRGIEEGRSGTEAFIDLLFPLRGGGGGEFN